MSKDLDVSGNPGRYVWFTTLYNARAYYPILAILFLDLGLTLDQFVMLNMVWAATIFLFEVPSGALADTLGRKTLLVSAAVLMVVEMSCLLFAPKDGGWVLFSLCVANRLLSGLSEAAASGADEALAYDSLPEGEKDDLWDDVLEKAMRYRSIAFVLAMVTGGLMYDPSIVNRVLPESLQISKEVAHRLPVAMVLIQGLVCVGITLSMVEPKKALDGAFWPACKKAMKLTMDTAKWVFTNPKTRAFVVIGLCIDAVVRNFATITSEYYRVIELPEWSFGFIGSAVGLGGIVVPNDCGLAEQAFQPADKSGDGGGSGSGRAVRAGACQFLVVSSAGDAADDGHELSFFYDESLAEPRVGVVAAGDGAFGEGAGFQPWIWVIQSGFLGIPCVDGREVRGRCLQDGAPLAGAIFCRSRGSGPSLG